MVTAEEVLVDHEFHFLVWPNEPSELLPIEKPRSNEMAQTTGGGYHIYPLFPLDSGPSPTSDPAR